MKASQWKQWLLAATVVYVLFSPSKLGLRNGHEP